MQELASKCHPCYGPRVEGDLPAEESDFVGSFDGCFNQNRPAIAAKNDFAKLHPSTFLHESIVGIAGQLEEDTGGKNFKAVNHGDTTCSDDWKAKDGGAGDGAFRGKVDTGLFG
ncbi:hypothetical protein B9479_001067 [Cryptococcus floricola]|uniref:Uncharacterized protein n=1 Tax=Cryptococcus floricola TaxID=2591691 RepID=A0A5D3B5I2_9TREE|nr:hypothetical protein B9479_001067 [Cryptococcus floricola]